MEIVVKFIEKLIALEVDPRILKELDEQLVRAQRKLEESSNGDV